MTDRDFDSLEYKKDIGPIEELIKYHILKDYYLYEQIINFKFNQKVDGIRNQTNNKSHNYKELENYNKIKKNSQDSIFNTNNLYDKSNLDVIEFKEYINMLNEYENIKKNKAISKDIRNKDMLSKMHCTKNNILKKGCTKKK